MTREQGRLIIGLLFLIVAQTYAPENFDGFQIFIAIVGFGYVVASTIRGAK